MAVFPRGSVLMAAPSQIHSLGKLVQSNNHVLSSDYALKYMVDGSADRPARCSWATVQITVDLGVARTPNLVGVLNHNIDPGRIITVSNEAGLSRGFAARDPNCWIDLRGFPTTARWWTIAINNNHTGVALSEFVVATATVFRDGVWEQVRETLTYPGYRESTEYAKTYICASGAILRKADLTLHVAEADRAALSAIWTEVLAASNRRVLVVPSTRVNDIWLCEWPTADAFTYENAQLRTLSLPLTESTGSVLTW